VITHNDQLLKILLIDADLIFCQTVQSHLSVLGYIVTISTNSEEVLITLNETQPDLVIFDVMFPKTHGYKICKELQKYPSLPLIQLTALNGITDRVLSFELGIDDYIVKPVTIQELNLRIRMLLARFYKNTKFQSAKTVTNLKVGHLTIDNLNKCILKNKKHIELTVLEFNLLNLLIRMPGVFLTRTTILNEIWGYMPERDIDTRLVDVYISRLRAKIEDDPSKPDLIITGRRIGYTFRNI
tara:strand:+ start:2507 stop:3229 length:723 start_codon:yes stop_codon:yes gene_type:complete